MRSKYEILQLSFFLCLIWLVIAVVYFGIYKVARRSLVNEIRAHTMGVAIAAAAGINTIDLEEIHIPSDVSRESYQRVQKFLALATALNPDIRYIYTMRRLAESIYYEFVVDQPDRDLNGNGRVDPQEKCELPGTRYNALPFPALMGAWHHPAADADVSADPPYPDLMSGYAPIKDKGGNTVAIVGVDVTAAQVSRKVFAVKLALAMGAFITALMLSALFYLYFRKIKFLDERNRLVADLQDALSQIKTLRGLLPVCSYCKKVRNDKGYWEQIEKYIVDHSEAEFTHGVCPECMKNLRKDARA